ncbi:MAG: SMC-Scp complex subunit ScpB [Pirellulales bacterium]|jgi:segregation and condensation protein B
MPRPPRTSATADDAVPGRRPQPVGGSAPAATGPSPPGFAGPPADGGLSIDRLAQAFAAMMGTADPWSPAAAPEVVHEDPTPSLDDEGFAPSGEGGCRVDPATILEALLFVGLPDGTPLTGRRVAGLMRGVRPQEIDDLAGELSRRYRANGCPYDVVQRDAGWVMRLRPEFAGVGRVSEARAKLVRLDAEALDLLALVAWNQPVARDQLVSLGCDAAPATLRLLVRRGLLELQPRPDAEPCYRTTRKFLDVFRLESLADLPPPLAPPR